MMEIVVNGMKSVRPRSKPIYKELRSDDKLLSLPVSDDFQQEVKNRLITITSRQGSKFPITGAVSILLRLGTSRPLSVIGVMKNMLDAGNGVLYSDDCHIESAVVNRYSVDNKLDVIDLDVISGTTLKDSNTDPEALLPYSVLHLHMETVAEDRYLPYPPKADYVTVVNTNDDDSLRTAIVQNLEGTPVVEGWGGRVSLTINTKSSRSDLDNIALNYLVGMTGIVYKDIKEVDSLHILTKVKEPEEEKVIVRLN